MSPNSGFSHILRNVIFIFAFAPVRAVAGARVLESHTLRILKE